MSGKKTIFLNSRLHSSLLVIIISVVFSAQLLLFFDFTAEDAFITYRYSVNLVDLGQPVYNSDEPVNAATSPLHTFVSAALYLVSGNLAVGNKILSLVILFTVIFFIYRRFREYGVLSIVTVGILLLNPCVVLWTVGGLETILLMGFVTAAILIIHDERRWTLPRLAAVCLFSSLAFLTRYDSILFFLPVFLYIVLHSDNRKTSLLALVLAGILPAVWLAWSYWYYGDILPTSYYVKTPHLAKHVLVKNGRYIFYNLINTGLIPVSVLGFWSLGSIREVRARSFRHLRSHWWLFSGLLFEMLYGLTMATSHMMFSFRFFVPYFPAALILIAGFLVREGSRWSMSGGTPGRSEVQTVVFGVALFLFLGFQGYYTYQRSLNGISPKGEYRGIGVRQYAGSFLPTLQKQAGEIRGHWQAAGKGVDRLPRILTFAGGVIPFEYTSSYVYTKIVSYRHGCGEGADIARSADYVHLMVPRNGSLYEQIGDLEERLAPISRRRILFDGSSEELIVYYNPNPAPHPLGRRITDGCL